MKGNSPDQNQRNLFRATLKEFINPNDPLVILADKFPWKELEKEFSGLYSHMGAPAKPVRLMVGLLLLKQMFNLGDETLLPQWVRNPYFQFFCGENEFQWEFPCDPSDLAHFRKRIGKEGVEKIFRISVRLQDKSETNSRDVIFDTTAQEKNITFPTDFKMYRRIVQHCNKIAKNEGVQLRQSYTRTLKELTLQQRFAHHPKRKKQADRARRKMKTIAGRQVRDIERKLSEDRLNHYRQKVDIYKRILNQKKEDKNKIYSIHEPDVACIAKGKAHKKYEFGSKVSFAMLPGSNVIVGVCNFQGNPHDSKTLEKTLEHARKMTGTEFKNIILDRGYRGRKKIGPVSLLVPGATKGKTNYEKQKLRLKFRSRAAIEPVIGHIKTDCRMARNYLKGTVGDEINAIMAATAFNMRILLRKIEKGIIFVRNFWRYILLPDRFFVFQIIEN